MGKRSKEVKQRPSVFEQARNELFSQIRHCGVLQATQEQRDDWLRDTMDYIGKRYPAMTQGQLAELTEVGRRYCEPVIPHGSQSGDTERDS